MNNTLKSLHKNKFDQQGKNQAGFTLIELAIVILIGGILVSFLGSALFAFIKKSQINKTHFKMEKVEEALADYLAVNGRYPCPAPRTAIPGDALYGQEVTATNCNTGTRAGTALNGGVRIGAVPTRALNLPDEYIADAWQQQFTYAVTGVLATPGQYVPNGGLVRLEDGASNSLVTPAGRAHYVLVSHGQTGDGSFPALGAANPSVPCPTAGTILDRENCNNNRLFINTLISSENNASAFFDDYVIFKGETIPIAVIPPNVVIPFNRATCPTGWTEYLPARGRFVVGAQAANKVLPRFDMALRGDNAILDFSNGNTNAGGDPRAIIPPYTALLYCEEN